MKDKRDSLLDNVNSILEKIDIDPQKRNEKIHKVENYCQAKGYRFIIKQETSLFCIEKKVLGKWNCNSYSKFDDMINKEGL